LQSPADEPVNVDVVEQTAELAPEAATSADLATSTTPLPSSAAAATGSDEEDAGEDDKMAANAEQTAAAAAPPAVSGASTAVAAGAQPNGPARIQIDMESQRMLSRLNGFLSGSSQPNPQMLLAIDPDHFEDDLRNMLHAAVGPDAGELPVAEITRQLQPLCKQLHIMTGASRPVGAASGAVETAAGQPERRSAMPRLPARGPRVQDAAQAGTVVRAGAAARGGGTAAATWVDVFGPDESETTQEYRKALQALRVSASRCFVKLSLPQTHMQLRQINYRLNLIESQVFLHACCSAGPLSLWRSGLHFSGCQSVLCLDFIRSKQAEQLSDCWCELATRAAMPIQQFSHAHLQVRDGKCFRRR
jgi:hypothetical protein